MKKIIILLIVGLILIGIATANAVVSLLSYKETKIDTKDGKYFYELNDTKTNEPIGYKFEVEAFDNSKTSKVEGYTMADMASLLAEEEKKINSTLPISVGIK